MIGAKNISEDIVFENHLLKRTQRKKKAKKMIFQGLMLTSMVDVFSMLVIFLLQTFSSTPEILVTKGVQLPKSITATEVQEAAVISMSKEEIFIDQKLVGKLSEVMKKPWMLTKHIKIIKTSWAKDHPGKPFPGEINLQADKEVESTIVAKMMGILNGHNFHSIKLAVVGGGI